MTDASHRHPFGNEQSDPPHHTSFIVRCWTGEGEKVHVRLTGVHSGVSRPMTGLADLPGLVRRWIAQAIPDQEDVR